MLNKIVDIDYVSVFTESATVEAFMMKDKTTALRKPKIGRGEEEF